MHLRVNKGYEYFINGIWSFEKSKLELIVILIVIVRVILIFSIEVKSDSNVMQYKKAFREIRTNLNYKNDPVLFMTNIDIQGNSSIIGIEIFKSKVPMTSAHFLNSIGSNMQKEYLVANKFDNYLLQVSSNFDTTKIPLEIKEDIKHKQRGTVGLSRDLRFKNSGSDDYYITVGESDKSALNGQYTIFGEVIYGKEKLDKIQRNSKFIDQYLIEIN